MITNINKIELLITLIQLKILKIKIRKSNLNLKIVILRILSNSSNLRKLRKLNTKLIRNLKQKIKTISKDLQVKKISNES